MPNQNDKHAPTPDGEVDLGRRKAINSVVGTAGVVYLGAIGYPVYKYLFTPVERAAELSKVSQVSIPKDQIPPAGSVLMFKFGSRPTMLIHHQDGSLIALDAICTHLGCTVAYQPENQRIFCACHAGVYDPKSGKNIDGPPPKPLTQYFVRQGEAGIDVSRDPFDGASAPSEEG